MVFGVYFKLLINWPSDSVLNVRKQKEIKYTVSPHLKS